MIMANSASLRVPCKVASAVAAAASPRACRSINPFKDWTFDHESTQEAPFGSRFCTWASERHSAAAGLQWRVLAEHDVHTPDTMDHVTLKTATATIAKQSHKQKSVQQK